MVGVLERLARLALMVWAVTTWVTGYVFAPILFAHNSKMQAGHDVGWLLNAVYLMSLGCAALMLLDVRVRLAGRLGQVREWVWVVLAVGLVVVQYVGISPKMAQLKSALLVQPELAASFAQWHGVSQLVYLLTSVLLVWMVWQRLLKS